MRQQPEFEWDQESRSAICLITYENQSFVGTALCHPDDEDMCSEKVGCEIALRRARIELLKYYRNKLKTEFQALRQVYHEMKQSKKFNPESYEVKKLLSSMNRLQFDFEFSKETLDEERKELRAYLAQKDSFYNKLRKKRESKDE